MSTWQSAVEDLAAGLAEWRPESGLWLDTLTPVMVPRVYSDRTEIYFNAVRLVNGGSYPVHRWRVCFGRHLSVQKDEELVSAGYFIFTAESTGQADVLGPGESALLGLDRAGQPCLFDTVYTAATEVLWDRCHVSLLYFLEVDGGDDGFDFDLELKADYWPNDRPRPAGLS